jgi:hypothetical protein
VPEEAVDLGVAVRKRTRRAGSERTQRSTSASQRFLFKLSRRASSKAGHAHFVLAAQQRASAPEFDLGLQSWSSSAYRFSHSVGSFSQRPLSCCTAHWLRPT